MNVVGKVGSLISQGVYSVATPFHPFGGAVDVIVVQQQDGTFRSTPWYVRFGKFQGVLKGAEKIVRINVNGIDAGFHMYLDNSGEAYFIKEVESGKGSEADRPVKDSDSISMPNEDGSVGSGDSNVVGTSRLGHSVSDSGAIQLGGEDASSGAARLQRAESDGERRYYDFQDEQSSMDDSVELSEYGSSRYEGLDDEHTAVSQGSDSEVILVSVDGHVLTAPVLASEKNTEDVQLCTPQFHLGPGDDTEEFDSGDDAWAANYINKLSASATDNTYSASSDDNMHQLKVCEGDGEHVCHSQEIQDIPGSEGDLSTQYNSDAPVRINKEEVFKSSLALPELAKNVGNADPEETDSTVEAHKGLLGESAYSPSADDQSNNGDLAEFPDNGCLTDSARIDGSPTSQVELETTEKDALVTEHVDSDGISIQSVAIVNTVEEKGEVFQMSTISERLDDGLQRLDPSETVEPQRTCEEAQTCSTTRFEISLCGKELHAGMGLDAAAEVFVAHHVSAEEFKIAAASIIKNENLIIRYGQSYFTWEKAAPIVLGMSAFGLDLSSEPKDAIPVERDYTPEPRDDDAGVNSSSSSRRWRLWPIPFRRVKTIEHTSSNSSSEELFVDSESGVQNSNAESTSPFHGGSESPHKQFIRTNVPTSEQIASLNLKDGQNTITFSFSTRVLGTQQVDCHIYLWKWNARIVISDVDGTITKSDVLGQFMPLVGKDWTQSGVAKLFCAIKENGYQLLFLSARAIVQAYLTRSFLFNLKQDGKTLPNGPVVISPDGLFPSLYREVIRRAPHEFKIACLEDIRRLFPADYNPFYAGFGNRDTDELSYRKIGIPKGKIFIINPKGEVAISHRIDVKSYTSLHTLTNDMFPPTSLAEEEDYNSWNFWKVPLSEIEM